MSSLVREPCRTSLLGGVGLSQGDAAEAGADGEAVRHGERVGIGAWVGTDELGDGGGDRDPGAAGPQLATTRAAARATLAMEPCTSESRSIT
jgi:hypothetical protein